MAASFSLKPERGLRLEHVTMKEVAQLYIGAVRATRISERKRFSSS
jgi:hypothetical protein